MSSLKDGDSLKLHMDLTGGLQSAPRSGDVDVSDVGRSAMRQKIPEMPQFRAIEM